MLEFLPQHLRSGLLSLPLVDVFHQDTLVLEAITFTLKVKFMVPETRESRLYLTIYKYRAFLFYSDKHFCLQKHVCLVLLLSMLYPRLANIALFHLCVYYISTSVSGSGPNTVSSAFLNVNCEKTAAKC